MRELMRALSSFESELHARHGVSLNEAMAMCCIGEDTLTSTAIAEQTGLTPSNTSKVLREMEKKDFITRAIGEADRRKMYFTLTPEGRRRLKALKDNELPLPAILQ